MPFRKKYGRKKRSYTRKKKYGYRKKKYSRGKRYSRYKKRSKSNSVTVWLRVEDSSTALPAANTDYNAYQSVKLDSITDYATYMDLWDWYKIHKCVSRWHVPGGRTDASQLGPAVAGWSVYPVVRTYHIGHDFCNLVTMYDPDGQNLDVDIATKLEDVTVKVKPLMPGKTISRTWKPYWTYPTYQTGTAWGYAKKSGYIPTDYPSTRHYGIPWGIQNATPAVDFSSMGCYYDCWAKITFKKMDKVKIPPMRNR